MAILKAVLLTCLTCLVFAFLFPTGEGEGEAPPDGQEEEGSQSGGEEEGSLGTAASSPPNSPPPLEPAVLVQPAEPIAPIRYVYPKLLFQLFLDSS